MGKIDIATFVAEDASAHALGHGSIEVTGSADESLASPQFEAAIIDRLAAVGYDTAVPAGSSTQVTELRIVRSALPSQKRPHKPISGEMSVGVSNRGSSMGLAINVDLSKPEGPLMSTKLEVRIRDRASNEVLWEGRAQMVTGEQDRAWTSERVATELAKALFVNFPSRA